MPSLHLSHLRKWFLQSPPVEWAIVQLRELLIGALRQGPIPQHVAFVMDGNRRFARNHRIETVEGHNLGFEALAKVIYSVFLQTRVMRFFKMIRWDQKIKKMQIGSNFKHRFLKSAISPV